MKKIVYLLFLGFVGLIMTSCKGDGTDIVVSKMPAKFESPANNFTVKLGEELRIEVSVLDPKSTTNLRVFTKDVEIFEGAPDKELLVFTLNTTDWKVGSTQISLEVSSKDGKTRRDNRVIKVLPNSLPIEYTAEAIEVHPHDADSYTQGLEFDGDQLYESTGSGGRIRESYVAKVDLITGNIKEIKHLDKKYFGEGLTIMGEELFMLTWQENTCFVYDKNNFSELKTFSYSGEGWGLTNDGEYLIMSDGSERLYFRDPKSFNVVKTIEVYDNRGAVKALNELEYVNGKIYANIYTKNEIVIIDANTGVVTGRIDASLIALDYRKGGEVLNGIAYKHSTQQLFITGKNWPYLIEIGLVKN